MRLIVRNGIRNRSLGKFDSRFREVAHRHTTTLRTPPAHLSSSSAAQQRNDEQQSSVRSIIHCAINRIRLLRLRNCFVKLVLVFDRIPLSCRYYERRAANVVRDAQKAGCQKGRAAKDSWVELRSLWLFFDPAPERERYDVLLALCDRAHGVGTSASPHSRGGSRPFPRRRSCRHADGSFCCHQSNGQSRRLDDDKAGAEVQGRSLATFQFVEWTRQTSPYELLPRRSPALGKDQGCSARRCSAPNEFFIHGTTDEYIALSVPECTRYPPLQLHTLCRPAANGRCAGAG